MSLLRREPDAASESPLIPPITNAKNARRLLAN